MLGTAEQVDAWLLLEYKSSWPGQAITQSSLTAETQAWLVRTQEQFAQIGLRLRPQLVRQPELEHDVTRLLLSTGGHTFEFSGHGYQFLLDLDLAALVQAGHAGVPSKPASAPRYLVCTNGKRDLCCARFGLPLYQRMRELVGDRVWQVTHLGGHRFAPNVLVIPQNVIYGRVQLEEAEAFVEQVEQGRLDFDHLRGRTQYPKVVQAAEGMLARQGLRLLHVAGGGDSGAPTEVTFADANETAQVTLGTASVAETILASCGDTETKAYFPFQRL
jgi:hypothetical protein